MPSITIRNVDKTLLARLKSRATRNKRSLNQELLYILELSKEHTDSPVTLLDRIRNRRQQIPDITTEEITSGKEDGRT